MLYLTLISLTLLSASSLSRGFASNDAAKVSVPFTTNAKRLAAGLPPLPPYKKSATRTKVIGRPVVPLNTNAQRLAAGLPPLPQNIASGARSMSSIYLFRHMLLNSPYSCEEKPPFSMQKFWSCPCETS